MLNSFFDLTKFVESTYRKFPMIAVCLVCVLSARVSKSSVGFFGEAF